MRARCYVRVSSEEQAREGLSLGVQEARLRAFCVAKGFDSLTIYTDEGRSAKNTKRASYQELVQNLETGDTVIACKLDRLFRNTRDALDFVEFLKAKGCDLIIIDESIDTSTPNGRFFFTLVAALASLEREQTAERTKRVISMLRASGRKYGPPPFGKSELEGTLVDDEAQLASLTRIRSLRGAGMSLREIASLLQSEGVRSPRGGPWQHSTVKYLLDKEGPREADQNLGDH